MEFMRKDKKEEVKKITKRIYKSLEDDRREEKNGNRYLSTGRKTRKRTALLRNLYDFINNIKGRRNHNFLKNHIIPKLNYYHSRLLSKADKEMNSNSSMSYAYSEILYSKAKRLKKDINELQRILDITITNINNITEYQNNTSNNYLARKQRRYLNNHHQYINYNPTGEYEIVFENSYGGSSQFVHIPNYGKRKVRYQKNGRAYVIVNKKKLKLN